MKASNSWFNTSKFFWGELSILDFNFFFQHFLSLEKLPHKASDIIKSHFIQNLSILGCFPTFHSFCHVAKAELNARSLAFWSFPCHRWNILLVFISQFSQLLLLNWQWRRWKQGPQESCGATAQRVPNLYCCADTYPYLFVHKGLCRKGNAGDEQRRWERFNPI